MRILRFRSKTNSKISLRSGIDKNTFLEGKNKIGKVNICSSSIGFGSYILSGSLQNAKVGRFCSIGHNVKVVTATHPIEFVSSFPGFYKTNRKDIFFIRMILILKR